MPVATGLAAGAVAAAAKLSADLTPLAARAGSLELEAEGGALAAAAGPFEEEREVPGNLAAPDSTGASVALGATL